MDKINPRHTVPRRSTGSNSTFTARKHLLLNSFFLSSHLRWKFSAGPSLRPGHTTLPSTLPAPLILALSVTRGGRGQVGGLSDSQEHTCTHVGLWLGSFLLQRQREHGLSCREVAIILVFELEAKESMTQQRQVRTLREASDWLAIGQST